MASPNDIEVLIHCYLHSYPHLHIDTPEVRDTINWFRQHGIVDTTGENTYGTTDKGAAWLQMILNTPFPTEAWVDENGEMIDVCKPN